MVEAVIIHEQAFYNYQQAYNLSTSNNDSINAYFRLMSHIIVIKLSYLVTECHVVGHKLLWMRLGLELAAVKHDCFA